MLRPRARRGPRQGRGRRWRAGCARSSGSTATPRRKASSSIRRPCTSADRVIDYESHVAHLDRNELGSILVTAGLSSPRDHALVSLLALNGLRVSEAIGANIQALGLERGHRTLTVLRKGGKLVTMPLAPTCRPGGRLGCRGTGRRPDLPRTPTSTGSIGMPLGGSCAESLAELESPSGSDLTRCATRSSPPPWTPASRCATCKKPPATPTRARRCDMTAAANPSTAT